MKVLEWIFLNLDLSLVFLHSFGHELSAKEAEASIEYAWQDPVFCCRKPQPQSKLCLDIFYIRICVY